MTLNENEKNIRKNLFEEIKFLLSMVEEEKDIDIKKYYRTRAEEVSAILRRLYLITSEQEKKLDKLIWGIFKKSL